MFLCSSITKRQQKPKVIEEKLCTKTQHFKEARDSLPNLISESAKAFLSFLIKQHNINAFGLNENYQSFATIQLNFKFFKAFVCHKYVCTDKLTLVITQIHQSFVL